MAQAPPEDELEIWFEPGKSMMNAQVRGLPLSCAIDFVWETALVWPDYRPDHFEEMHFIAVGLLNHRLHVMSFGVLPPYLAVFSLRRINTAASATARREPWLEDFLPPHIESLLARGGSARAVLGAKFVNRAPGKHRRTIDPKIDVRTRLDRRIEALRQRRAGPGSG